MDPIFHIGRLTLGLLLLGIIMIYALLYAMVVRTLKKLQKLEQTDEDTIVVDSVKAR